jgi:hypothetical protein
MVLCFVLVSPQLRRTSKFRLLRRLLPIGGSTWNIVRHFCMVVPGRSTGGLLWARWAYRLDRLLCLGLPWFATSLATGATHACRGVAGAVRQLAVSAGSPQRILPNSEVPEVFANPFLVC